MVKCMEYKSRINKYKEHEKEAIKRKEEELAQRREELKKIVFNEDMDDDFINLKMTGKPTLTNIILSILFVLVVAFCFLLIYISSEKINELYYIINALFILIIMISYLVSFKHAFMYKRVRGTLVTILFTTIFILFNALYIVGVINLPTQKTVPNFYAVSYKKALKWADENKVKINATYEYSDEVKEGSIISQSTKAGKFVKDISSINYVISIGTNTYKEVNIPNMTGKNINKTLKMIKQYKLNNIDINYVENKSIEKNTIIKQSVSGDIRRNTKVIFDVSLGDISNLKDIKMKDLYNESYLNASVYLQQNGIKYDTTYEFSSNVKAGYIINSSIPEGSTVSTKDNVTLTISKGKGITVPDFSSKSEDMVLKNCNKLGIKCLLEFSNDESTLEIVATGQSIESGTIISKDEYITINMSNKTEQ